MTGVLCKCVNVEVRYKGRFRSGGGHNRFHMLRKDKEKNKREQTALIHTGEL